VNKFSQIACLFLLLFIQNNLFVQILIKDSKQVYEISSGWTFQPEGLMPKQVQVGKGLVSQNLLPPISGIYSVEIEYSVLDLNYPQGIFLDIIQDADRVYFNGQLIGSTGIFPPEGDYNPNWLLKRLYFIPSNLINLEGKNQLKIEIIFMNPAFPGGLFRSIPAIGNMQILEEKIIYEDGRVFALIMLFFGVGAYQLFSIFLRRQALANFFLLMSSFSYIMWRVPLINFFINNSGIPFVNILSIFFFFQTVFPVSILFFCYSILEQKVKWFEKIMIFIFLSIATIQAFPIDMESRIDLLHFWEILLIPSIFLLTFRIIAAIRQDKKEAILITIGICILFFAGITDILIDILTGRNIYLTQYGFLGMMIFSAISVSYRNAKNEKELSKLTVELEQRVLDRTQEIVKNNEDLVKDLSFAARIQVGLLPKSAPNVKNLNIAARYIPMSQVGGDFYDWIEIDEHRLLLILIDVSGHGVSSALISSMVKVQFTNFVKEYDSPDEILYHINNSLSNLKMNSFVTANCTLFDTLNKKVFFASAGHPHPLVTNINSNKTEYIELKGMILGWKGNKKYPLVERSIKPGERYFFYTDGVTEAKSKNSLFGEEKLFSLIQSTKSISIEDASKVILETLMLYNGNVAQDDLTFVIVDII
jgi:sigma-B regulation protein RsbU (phosphoserine phosphatase)